MKIEGKNCSDTVRITLEQNFKLSEFSPFSIYSGFTFMICSQALVWKGHFAVKSIFCTLFIYYSYFLVKTHHRLYISFHLNSLQAFRIFCFSSPPMDFFASSKKLSDMSYRLFLLNYCL